MWQILKGKAHGLFITLFLEDFNSFMTEAVIRLLYTNSLQSKSMD